MSIHDVSPLHWNEIKALFSLVERLGIRKGTLLVVPNFHGQSPLWKDKRLLSWLKGLEGSWEIALHGYTHQDDYCRPEKDKSSASGVIAKAHPGKMSFIQHMVSHYYTQMEGEFYLLPYEEASHRIDLGFRILNDCGLSPSGFVAPAWLLSEGSFQAVSEFDFKYTTRLEHVYWFSKHEGRKRKVMESRAPAITFSSRTLLRACLSRAIVPLLARRASGSDLIRLALHPKDAHHKFILSMAADLIEMLLEDRELLTIGEYIDSQESKARQHG